MNPVGSTKVARAEIRLDPAGHKDLHNGKGWEHNEAYDIIAPGATVVAPIRGKVGHIAKDTHYCPGSNLAFMFSMSEEIWDEDGDRKGLTGFRIRLGHIIPVPGLGVGKLRHVEEGTVLGTVAGQALHIGGNRPDRLVSLLGI